MIESLRQRIRRILTEPAGELGRGAKFLRYQIYLWRFCARRLRQNNALAMSSALSFRTIFAMIPVLVLWVTMLSSFGGLQKSAGGVHSFLRAAGLSNIVVTVAEDAAGAAASQPAAAASGPAEQKTVTVNLSEKIEQAVRGVEDKLTLGTIGPIGAVLLFWAALTLLTTIERSLNRIFGAPRSRSFARRVLLYWSVVTLGPIALGTTIYVFRKAESSLADLPSVQWLFTALNWVGPILVGMLLLAGLYKLMPNTRVSNRAAAMGAILAVPLWLVGKWLFSLYVTKVVTLGSLYGALGLLPLFLIWLNLSWLIFLFGAELAHTATSLRQLRTAELARRTVVGPWDMLAAALAVAGPYARDEGPVETALVADRLALPEPTVRELLEKLAAAGILLRVETDRKEGYVPARPPAAIPLRDVLTAGRDQMSPAGEGDYDADLARTVQRVRRRAAAAMENLSLTDVLDEGPDKQSNSS